MKKLCAVILSLAMMLMLCACGDVFSKAEAGKPEAMNELGAMYYFGDGVEQDYTKALEWWTKAAEGGDASAMRGVGIVYYLGEGVEKDEVKAQKWEDKFNQASQAYSLQS